MCHLLPTTGRHALQHVSAQNAELLTPHKCKAMQRQSQNHSLVASFSLNLKDMSKSNQLHPQIYDAAPLRTATIRYTLQRKRHGNWNKYTQMYPPANIIVKEDGETSSLIFIFYEHIRNHNSVCSSSISSCSLNC